MAKRKIERYRHRPLWQILLKQVSLLILWVFLFSVGFRAMIGFTLLSRGSAMSPSIQEDRLMFVLRIPYGMHLPFIDTPLPAIRQPAYGDIAVLDNPFDNSRHIAILSELEAVFWGNGRLTHKGNPHFSKAVIIRRVIARGGDRLYLNGGTAYIQPGGSGDFIEETLLSAASYRITFGQGEFNNPDLLSSEYSATIEVPEGYVYVLPDDRLNSLGSEAWGLISLDELEGRVVHQW